MFWSWVFQQSTNIFHSPRFSYTLSHWQPEDFQMFLFMENNRLSFFLLFLWYLTRKAQTRERHLAYTPISDSSWLQHDTKASLSVRILIIIPESYCSVPSFVLIPDEFKSAVLCSSHIQTSLSRFFQRTIRYWKPAWENWGQTLQMIVNNISQIFSFLDEKSSWCCNPYALGRRLRSCCVLHFLLSQMFWPNKQ